MVRQVKTNAPKVAAGMQLEARSPGFKLQAQICSAILTASSRDSPPEAAPIETGAA